MRQEEGGGGAARLAVVPAKPRQHGITRWHKRLDHNTCGGGGLPHLRALHPPNVAHAPAHRAPPACGPHSGVSAIAFDSRPASTTTPTVSQCMAWVIKKSVLPHSFRKRCNFSLEQRGISEEKSLRQVGAASPSWTLCRQCLWVGYWPAPENVLVQWQR